MGPANPSHWPSIQPFSEHQKVEALQAQGPRGHKERVYGLWSFNQEGRQLKVEWWVGLGSGTEELPLVPEHFLYIFSGHYLFLVDIISNRLKLYKQVINIDFLHSLYHLSMPLRFG